MIEKTVFIATTIVAGTKNVKSAEKVDATASPIPIPIKEPVTLSIPNLLTITKIAPINKKVWESFSETFSLKPTTKPKMIKMAYIGELN